MMSQEQLKSEIDVLSEKIETFEEMLKSSKSKQSGVNGWISRKLREYKSAHDKLADNYSALFGETGAEVVPRMRHPVN